MVQCQRRVCELLAQTSRDLESINELPTVDTMRKLESDLEVKRKLMKDAEVTAVKLGDEVQMRRQELDNLQNVDVKISEEIEATKRQMREWEAEMPNFADVDAIREEGEARKKRLIAERDRLKVEQAQLKKVASALATKFNENRQGLRNNPIFTKLHDLEKDIRTRATENFAIVEFIEDNRRRTNYSLVKRQAMTIVTEINSLL
jgi:intraflagellar transport protein 74